MTCIEKQWHVYVIQTLQGKLYTGITTDVARRFNEHANKKGAKFFFIDPPACVVWSMTCSSKSEALKKEAWMKKLPSSEKRKFIDQSL